ncbi:hypothetical protein BSL78_20216 [Apostichopus japonicus]|uniref:C2H2-type domain-containing protein n=1 Tax=Stichopus japonicus TaxID=307972 RepID=A0A2G8K4I9_STIJA|nr:hypothetical protein BSL78_20216 [Apostichopus japonicus]
MSWNTGSENSQRWSPRRRLWQKEEVALNSKYSAEDVLKTIATKDVLEVTCESNLRTPLPSEGRENQPKQVQQVKQESPEVALKRKAVSKLRKVRAVKSPRLIHSVCKKCKVGFIDPTVLITHKCNDRATVVNQSQESANGERDGRRNERRGNHQEREQNSDQVNPSALCRQSHRSSHPSVECKSIIPQVSPLPSPDVVSQNCEMGSSDVSVSQGKPRKRLTQIEWFPAPIEVWIGYEACSCMCMTCAACIPSLQVLLQHNLPRPPGTLTCKACQVDFVSNCYRFVHNLKNHQFICPFCPKRFKTKTIAKTHTLKQHQDQDLHEVQSLTFTRDGKSPIDLTALSKPPSTVRAQILGKVKCYKKGQMGSMICGKILGSPDTALSFQALRSLQDDHKAGKSVPRAMVKCLLCLEDIPGYVTLEEHMIVTHTPRTYNQLRAVVGEDREGETEPRNSISIPVNGNNTSLSTPFCNECQKVFQDTRALKRHNLSVHSVSTSYRLALSQKLTESKQREQLTNVLHSPPATKAEMLHVSSAQTKGKRPSRNGEVKKQRNHR